MPVVDALVSKRNQRYFNPVHGAVTMRGNGIQLRFFGSIVEELITERRNTLGGGFNFLPGPSRVKRSTLLDNRKCAFYLRCVRGDILSLPTIGMITLERKIKERPEQVKTVLRTVLKRLRFLRENREEAVRVAMGWLSIDLLAKRSTVPRKTFSPAELTDFSLLEEAP